MSADDYSFKAFSQHSFYCQVNKWLLDRASLGPGWTVVDLACGSGAVTELILEHIRGARDAVVIGLDNSASALRDARDRLAGTRDAVVQFVQAQAEDMSSAIRHAADAVIFCNGIHYIKDKQRLLAEIYRSLRPGGVFAFNTSFFEGANPPETQRFYRRWMIRALRTLKRRYGLAPDRKKVEARHQLTPEQYRTALEAQGFEIRVLELVPAAVSEQGWLDISRFADFVGGVMPGVPIEHASEVLCEALRETCAELEIQAVPRNWLSVIAARA